MNSDEMIQLLGVCSQSKTKELLVECMEYFNVCGLKDLKDWQLEYFCRKKKLIEGGKFHEYEIR